MEMKWSEELASYPNKIGRHTIFFLKEPDMKNIIIAGLWERKHFAFSSQLGFGR